MEETIRYGMPGFKLKKEDIYISAYAKHIGMYPMYGMEPLEKELAATVEKTQRTLYIFRIINRFHCHSLQRF